MGTTLRMEVTNDVGELHIITFIECDITVEAKYRGPDTVSITGMMTTHELYDIRAKRGETDAADH